MSIERAHRIAAPVVAQLGVFAARWAEEHRLPLSVQQDLEAVATECVVTTLFELPISVVYCVKDELIRPIVEQVGWDAMYEALLVVLGADGPPDATSPA